MAAEDKGNELYEAVTTLAQTVQRLEWLLQRVVTALERTDHRLRSLEHALTMRSLPDPVRQDDIGPSPL